jgi:serine/threonine protein kinase
MVLCSSFKHAHAEISECLLRLAQGWVRLDEQLSNIVHIEPLMNNNHRAMYNTILSTLQMKLEVVNKALEEVINVKDEESHCELEVKRLKFALKKYSLDRTLRDAEEWMKNADLTWFLILRMSSPRVDAALTRVGPAITETTPSILPIRAGLHGDISSTAIKEAGTSLSRTAEFLEDMQIAEISMSDALLAQRSANGAVSSFILNKVNCPPLAKYNDVKRGTRDLARKLQHKDPDAFGLLNCEAFVANSTEQASQSAINFTLIFGVPSGRSNPKALRDVLLNIPAPESLTYRLLLARNLAKSVGFVHTFGFVHKNLRPESILSFDSSAGSLFPSVFLVGFENFRKEEGGTQRLGDQTFEGNLYLHPNRQGTSPQEKYIMQHDIYSLGVVLLEVGFWRSFVEYDPQDGSIKPTALLGAPTTAKGGQLLRYVLLSGQDRILSLARFELPKVMGTEYARVVETCLTCLDDNNDDFGDQSEFEDEDGIVVGARYIEKVSQHLVSHIHTSSQ